MGLVVGASAPGERALWHRGDLPDGPRSMFEIGSITKTFTATLLADMARDGLVALHDPVNRNLPGGVRVPRAAARSRSRISPRTARVFPPCPAAHSGPRS